MCESCKVENAVASKVCKICKKELPIKQKMVKEELSGGSINSTTQKNIIHKRLFGLNEKSDVHAFVVYIKKGKRSIMTDSYATPGFASEFIGEKKNRSKIGS